MAKPARTGDEHDVLQAADARKPGAGKSKFGIFGALKSNDSTASLKEATATLEDGRVSPASDGLPPTGPGSSGKKGNIISRLLSRSSSKKKTASPSPSASSGDASNRASPGPIKQSLSHKFDSVCNPHDFMDSDGYESANSNLPSPKPRDDDQRQSSSPLGFQGMDVSPGPVYGTEDIDITLTPGMIAQHKREAMMRQQQYSLARTQQPDDTYALEPTVLISKEMLSHGNLPMMSPAFLNNIRESAPMDISPMPQQHGPSSSAFAFCQPGSSPAADTPVLAPADGSPTMVQKQVEQMLAAAHPEASPEPHTPAYSDTSMMDLDTPLTFTIAKTLQFRPHSSPQSAAKGGASLVASISQLLDAAAPTPQQDASSGAAAASPTKVIPPFHVASAAAFGSPAAVQPSSPAVMPTPTAPSPATVLASLPLDSQPFESELPGRVDPPASPATPFMGSAASISRNLSVGRLNSKLCKLSVQSAASAEDDQQDDAEEVVSQQWLASPAASTQMDAQQDPAAAQTDDVASQQQAACGLPDDVASEEHAEQEGPAAQQEASQDANDLTLEQEISPAVMLVASEPADDDAPEQQAAEEASSTVLMEAEQQADGGASEHEALCSQQDAPALAATASEQHIEQEASPAVMMLAPEHAGDMEPEHQPEKPSPPTSAQLAELPPVQQAELPASEQHEAAVYPAVDVPQQLPKEELLAATTDALPPAAQPALRSFSAEPADLMECDDVLLGHEDLEEEAAVHEADISLHLTSELSRRSSLAQQDVFPATAAPPPAQQQSPQRQAPAELHSSPLAGGVPHAQRSPSPAAPAASASPTRSTSLASKSSASGVVVSHAVSVDLDMADSLQSAVELTAQAAAVEEQSSTENVTAAPEQEQPLSLPRPQQHAAFGAYNSTFQRLQQHSSPAAGAVRASVDEFQELERQLAAEEMQMRRQHLPSVLLPAAEEAEDVEMMHADFTPAAGGDSPVQTAEDRQRAAAHFFSQEAEELERVTAAQRHQQARPERSSTPDLQEAFDMANAATPVMHYSPMATQNIPPRHNLSPGLIDLEGSADDLLQGTGMSYGFDEQQMGLPMPERTPSPAELMTASKSAANPLAAVRDSMPLFGIPAGHVEMLDDQGMDLHTTYSFAQGTFKAASAAAFASNLETVQEAPFEGSPTSSIVSNGSAGAPKALKAGKASPSARSLFKPQAQSGIGRGRLAAATTPAQERAAAPQDMLTGSALRQPNPKAQASLKKLAAAPAPRSTTKAAKTPAAAPQPSRIGSGIPTPGTGFGSGRRTTTATAAMRTPMHHESPTTPVFTNTASPTANATPYTAPRHYQAASHQLPMATPPASNPDLQLSDMETPTMGFMANMGSMNPMGASPTLPLDMHAACNTAAGAAGRSMQPAAAGPRPAMVWHQDFQTPIMAQMRNMPIEAALNAPLLDSSPFPDDLDTKCLQEEARRLAIAMGNQPTPPPPAPPAPEPAAEAGGADLREDLQRHMMLKISQQDDELEKLRRENAMLKEELQTLQFASTSMQESDEMERQARMFAEQQASVFRDKAADLDQRLQKQMEQTQDLFETNKDLNSRLQRAQDDHQFRIAEMQAELDSAREEHDKLQSTIGQLSSRINDLTDHHAMLRQRNIELEEQVQSLQAKHHRVKQEMTALTDTKDQLSKRHEKALATLITTEAENEKLKNQNQELAYKAKLASEEAHGMRAQYEHTQQQAQLLMRKYEQKKKHVEQLLMENAARKREVEEVMAMCHQLLSEREAGK